MSSPDHDVDHPGDPDVVVDDDIRDELPADLQPDEFIGAYEFPDNSRRRIPGVIYVILALGCLALYLTARDSSALVNEGFGWAALLLGEGTMKLWGHALMAAVPRITGTGLPDIPERSDSFDAPQISHGGGS